MHKTPPVYDDRRKRSPKRQKPRQATMLVYTDEEILTFAIFCGTQSGIAHCCLEREAVVQIEDDKRLIARSIKQQTSQLYYKRAVRSADRWEVRAIVTTA
jgi:hypothetical protein